MGRRNRINPQTLTRLFEVEFQDQPTRTLNLQDDPQAKVLGAYLTNPVLALTVHQATCYLPEPRLQHLNFLDTAGLCSPIGFHKDITLELLQRRPDKILVIIDACGLETHTSREALTALRRFVSVPDDYRQVTFVLTFWDHLLRTYMEEDAEELLDFSDPGERARAARWLAREKRAILKGLLGETVGVPCQWEPAIFPLGLGANAPAEMRRGEETLWRHLENECKGWVATDMWTKRWQSALQYGPELQAVYEDTLQEVREAYTGARDRRDLAGRKARIALQRAELKQVCARARANLKGVVESHRQLLLSEIGLLNSKKDLLAYLEEGCWKSCNNALNALQAASRQQKEEIQQMTRSGWILKVISLDRKLLALDPQAKKAAKGELSGFLYGLRAIWDFLLGSLCELNESHRAAVKATLEKQVNNMTDLFNEKADDWLKTAHQVEQAALEGLAEKEAALQQDEAGNGRHIEAFSGKLAFLQKIAGRVKGLTDEMSRYAGSLAEACELIHAGRPGFPRHPGHGPRPHRPQARTRNRCISADVSQGHLMAAAADHGERKNH